MFYGAAVVGIAFVLLGLRFTYAVFGLVPLALALGTWRTVYRKLSLALIVVYLILAGVFAVLISMENNREVGVLAPSTGGNPTRWFYAWHQVFTLHLGNRQAPKLQNFYDNGDVFEFQREVAASVQSPRVRSVVYDQEVDEMFAASGLSQSATKFESMFWGVIGGRLHGVGAGVKAATESTGSGVDELIFFNSFARSHGASAFANRYNDSRVPSAIVTDQLSVRLPLRDSQTIANLLLPVAIFGLAVGSFKRPTRAISLLGMGVPVVTSLGVAVIMADNYRFLIASSGFALASATAVASRLWEGRHGRYLRQSVRAVRRSSTRSSWKRHGDHVESFAVDVDSCQFDPFRCLFQGDKMMQFCTCQELRVVGGTL